MSDIIEEAKRLLAGATPAPWEPHADQPKCLVSLETQFAVAVVPESDRAGSEDESNRNLIAAAPEFAQALAEDSYEYIVQVKRANEWQFYIGESHMVSDNPGAAYGFSQRSNALEFSKMETKRPTRIVRRRVSPVEVIE